MSEQSERRLDPEPEPPRPSPGSSCWFGLLAAFVGAALVVGVALAVRRGGGEADPTTPVDAVLEASDVVATPLEGELSNLSVIYSASRGDAAVVGVEIEVLDADDAYALWWGDVDDRDVDEGGVALVVAFRPDSDGTVEVAVEDFADRAAEAGVDLEAAVYAVTIERSGELTTPTGSVVARS